jgi:hypothetical protein
MDRGRFTDVHARSCASSLNATKEQLVEPCQYIQARHRCVAAWPTASSAITTLEVRWSRGRHMASDMIAGNRGGIVIAGQKIHIGIDHAG